MPNPVSAAIGTQRQFAIQPKSVYQSGIKPLSVGNGITQRTNQDAAALANALGIVGTAVNNEALAADRREREQFTALEAQKMIAGKTPEDLAKFDRIQALQHSDKGYDLTDNPYAMATLDQSIGQVAAASAKEKWATENTGTPKTINEAVQAYHGLLQDTYGSFKDSIKNSVSFDKGFYEGYQRDILQVANEAHTRINNEARSKGQRAINVKMQGLISSAGQLDTVSFAKSFGELARELQSYVKNSDEALKIIQGNLETLVENDVSTEKLNAIKDTAYYGADRKIGDELPLFKLYKKIADNYNLQAAVDIYDQCKRPDGTLDLTKAKTLLESYKGVTNVTHGIPQVYLPQTSGDLDSLKPELKTALPSIGGILSQLGYGNIAEYTSGYRDQQRNAEANGSPTSYHLQGDAVDVYVGNITAPEQQQISNAFDPYFSEILYHDAGSGLHLHLAGYQGGMVPANTTETTAAAYTPERRQTIWNKLETMHKDAQATLKQQQDDYKAQISQQVDTAATYTDKVDIITNSSLPATTKKQLLSFIKKEADLLEDTSDMTSDELYYLTQYRKQGNKECAYNKDYATYYNYLQDSTQADFEDPDDRKAKAFLKAQDNLKHYEKALNNVYAKRNHKVPEKNQKERKIEAEYGLHSLKTIVKNKVTEGVSQDRLYQATIDYALLHGIPVADALEMFEQTIEKGEE